MSTLGLHTLVVHPAARRRRRRVGRGNASRGTYSGRGMKGQRSRAGGRRGMIRRSLRSLLERVSKRRGFRSLRGKPTVVNVRDLDRVFERDEVVTPTLLEQRGLITSGETRVRILGAGTLSKPLTVHAHAFSKGARQALERAGGKVLVLGGGTPRKNKEA